MFFGSSPTAARWTVNALLLLALSLGSPEGRAQAPGAENLALASRGAEATALNYGTFSGNRRVAQKANDGNPNTAWGGTWTDGQRPNWLQIKLAETARISAVSVNLGTHTLVYRLERSMDGTDWTTIRRRVRHEQGKTQTFEFDPVRARYIRMVCLRTNAPQSHIWQYIVKELKVFSAPKPPSILSINATPNPTTAGQTVQFSANVENADRHRWTFGDGNSASGATVSYTYDNPGQYTAKLTARSAGGRDTRTLTVRVTPAEDEEPTTTKRPSIDTQVPETPMHRSNAIAVVIGNKTYRNSDIPDVKYAARDAQVMKKYLTRTLGVREGNVIYVENATAAALTRIFGTADDPKGQLYNWVKPGKSEVFVYYSGHGAPSPESGRAYLIPSNANPNYLSQNGYPVEQLYNNLAKVPAKSVTVMMEACFSGVSEDGAVVQNASPVELSVENPVLAMKNGLAFTAGAVDQIASWYPKKKHGMFTYFFLKGLRGAADRDGNRAITGAEMGKYVKEKVPYRARRMYNREQTPQVVGPAKGRVLVRYQREVLPSEEKTQNSREGDSPRRTESKEKKAPEESLTAVVKTDMPRGKKLMASAKDALGGSAFDQIKSMRVVTKQRGRTSTVVVKLPNKMRIERGGMTITSDGSTVKMKRGGKTRTLPSSIQGRITGQLWRSIPYLMANLDHEGLSVRAQGDTTISGTTYKTVWVQPPSGTAFTLYLDAETMRPKRLSYEQTNPRSGATVDVTQTLSDFREVSGAMMPFTTKTVQSTSKGERTITANVQTFEINVEPTDALFTLDGSPE